MGNLFVNLFNISGYLFEQIINLDETGLVWRKTPNRTLGPKGKEFHGHKSPKNRVTLLLGIQILFKM